ncbi:conjugative transposon protein TraM [Subsaximicrobium wynnwilliamsii]|uniref:Conjugative transposon protein TraM n=1 Tax=Subsaximicrobium wynnwilliamsii TaxID=291179 RepID=A0A5C6ZB15_9FLAO|nr:conjugative transposon protein TraM [Subsaximicrobium wynnwilliamsii]TXD81514.1 conjugative transposon protein TraM [Subsaximicrobium wynnwilliamsii]TXD87180.1 conjugative transposon protein TraM [Subsaximicrobium wynnwilliamsii]TXE00874.1 conjugative transposon protein TraM [Subsaximicrobium wynnwilliamsii]
MKIEKNKIVFGSVMGVILIFLVSYTFMVMGDDESEDESLKQTLVPALEENQKIYDSKLDAINDLKEVRQANAPSIYDEKLMDSLGFYDADYTEKEKKRIVDSIYSSGRISYSETPSENSVSRKPRLIPDEKVDMEPVLEIKELGFEHQLFFSSAPKENKLISVGSTDDIIYVTVDGTQIVKTNSRLRMRLTKEAIINNILVEKNTSVYGFVNFQPNRATIEIENIQHQPTHLKAFDLQDGSEGLYVENNFRAEATNEVVDGVIQDINIPSVPQIGGITRVLKRNNRNIKVTILNNYKLILKPTL